MDNVSKASSKQPQPMSVLRPPPSIKGSCFDEAAIETARSHKRLLSVSLLLSNKCNLRCTYCYTNAGVSESAAFGLQQWRDVLEQAKELGADSVWIPGSGEPMLDPAFCQGDDFPLIDLCNSLGMAVTFFTNGTQLTSARAKRLASLNVSVVTKLNSFNAHVQDELVGSPGASPAIYNGLRLLLDAGLAESDPSRLGIDTVIVSQNYNEIEGIYRFCRENNIIPYVTANLHGGRACGNPSMDISRDMLRGMFERLLRLDETLFGFTWLPSPPIAGGQCKKLLYDVVVDYRGDVLLCPGINLTIGNVLDRRLSEIIKDSELLDRIRGMPKTLSGKCSGCKFTECSYGCRLEAWANGDIFGDDPMCWHHDRQERAVAVAI